jgi:hypothetical protein
MSRSGPLTRDTSAVALGLAQIRVGNAAANIATTTSVLTGNNSIGALGTTKFSGNVDYWKMESGFPMLEDMTIPLRESAKMDVTYKELSSFNLALARGIDPLGAVAASAAKGSAAQINSTSGTITGEITVTTTTWVGGSITAGVVSDTWTVIFTGATAGSITGKNTGWVHTFAALDSAMAPTNGGTAYFSLPSGFFSGTWANKDSYTFTTVQGTPANTTYANNHAGSIALGGMVAPAFIRMEAVYTYPNGTNHMYIIFPRANATASTEIDMQAEDAAAPPLSFEAKRADSLTAGGDAAWDLQPLGVIYFD